MCVRLIRIHGVDLNVFEFDGDLTWTGFFLDPKGERVLGRFGGRDAKDSESRFSSDALNHTMKLMLAQHKALAQSAPPPAAKPPLHIEKVGARLGVRPNTCIHCHQSKELLRMDAMANKTWDPEDRWVYPLPDNIGFTLERDRGNIVDKVFPGSVAAKAGLARGDTIERLAGRSVLSFADAQFALHKAPRDGSIEMVWQHDGGKKSAALELAKGWRKTNITWRPSLLDLIPTLRVYGDDLSAAEKKKLGLAPERTAFRQDATVQPSMQTIGLKGGDIIVGVDGKALETTVDGFLGHIRQNYLVGDRITLDIYRGQTPLALPLTLK